MREPFGFISASFPSKNLKTKRTFPRHPKDGKSGPPPQPENLQNTTKGTANASAPAGPPPQERSGAPKPARIINPNAVFEWLVMKHTSSPWDNKVGAEIAGIHMAVTSSFYVPKMDPRPDLCSVFSWGIRIRAQNGRSENLKNPVLRHVGEGGGSLYYP